MKKLLSILIANLAVLAITLDANGQNNLASSNEKLMALNSKSKNLTKTASNTADINIKALKKFKKDFPGNTNDIWAKTNNGYVVRFTSNTVQNWAFLTRHGNCQISMRYYTEKELPASVRNQVKSTYYDFSITSVKEISNNKSTAYLVTIEDETTWKIIRVVDGEMDVLEEYTK